MDRSGIAGRDVALKNSMNQAIQTAGLSPKDIGHIHAHGLSTHSCDIDESREGVQALGEKRKPEFRKHLRRR